MNLPMRGEAAAVLAALALTAASALAYTPFIAAPDGWPTVDHVSAQGASTQTFYAPGVALPSNFQIATPDGKPGNITGFEVGADMTRVDVGFDAPGTYKISTGEMLGQVLPIWDFGDDTAGTPLIRTRHDGEETPERGTAATYQSVQVASTYVTYGAPTRAVVDHSSDHLVIHPITDPNQVTVASGIQFEILFNGAVVPTFSVVLNGNGDADTNLTHFVNTDALGRGAFTFTAPGRYTIVVRKLARAPAGSAATIFMYTSTLTFDVMAEQHANVEIARTPAQTQDQRRRRQGDWRQRF